MPADHIMVLLGTGIVVALAQGVLGLGGAFIMVPVLVAIFTRQDIPADTAVKLAIGSNLLVVLTTAISSSVAHHREGSVWWKAAVILGISGAVGALIGSILTSQLISGEVLKPAFGVLTILVGIRMLISNGSKNEGEPEDNPMVWLIWGFPAGLVVGVIGVGGGILFVPIMTTVFRFSMHRAVGTSTGTMLLTASAGTLGYVLNGLSVSGLPAYSIGYVNLTAWVCLAATSIGTAQIAARVAHKLQEKVIRIIFVILMLYMGLGMIGLFEWPGF